MEKDLLEEKKRGDAWQEQATAKNKAGECGVCMDACVGVAFEPCGHTLCVKCGSRVRRCPFCQEQIDSRKRIYLS